MVDIQSLIEQERSAQQEHVDVDIVLGGEVITVRLTRIPPVEYKQIVGTFPPHDTSHAEKFYGFSVYEATPALVKASATVLDGDKTVEMSNEQWDEVFSVIAAEEVEAFADAVIALNVLSPFQKRAQAKKARAAKSR